MVEEAVAEGYAVLEFTYDGEQGTVNQPVPFDMPDADIIKIAEEALKSGDVTGITQTEHVDLSDYKVDRFPSRDGLPCRISSRPKTPFGWFYI